MAGKLEAGAVAGADGRCADAASGLASPAGVAVEGEYWLSSAEPVVVVILEADSSRPLFEMALTWQDVFSIDCVPACTPEDGLAWGPAMLERRPD